MQIFSTIHNKTLKRLMSDEYERVCIKVCSNEQDAEENIKYFENSEWKKISDLLFEILDELYCECVQFPKRRETVSDFLRWALHKLSWTKRELEAKQK